MPKLITRQGLGGTLDIYIAHVAVSIGEILPHMSEDDGSKLEWHGHMTLRGKHVDQWVTETRDVTGVIGETPEKVLAVLERYATEFYGDGYPE